MIHHKNGKIGGRLQKEVGLHGQHWFWHEQELN